MTKKSNPSPIETEVLRRMLNTPPTPITPKAAKPAKRRKKK